LKSAPHLGVSCRGFIIEVASTFSYYCTSKLCFQITAPSVSLHLCATPVPSQRPLSMSHDARMSHDGAACVVSLWGLDEAPQSPRQPPPRHRKGGLQGGGHRPRNRPSPPPHASEAEFKALECCQPSCQLFIALCLLPPTGP
jgi:hypothetical protein